MPSQQPIRNAACTDELRTRCAVVTDTHCIRLCNRIGLVDGVRDPKKVEMALWKLLPP